MALAQIYGLRIPIAGLDDGQIHQLAAAAPFVKANFNPDLDEPRDDHGRWTDEGGGESESRSAAPVSTIITGTAAAAEAGATIFGAIGRAALAGLVDLAADFAAPTAFLGVLFLPTNSSLVSEGALPGRPDLDYRYDQDTGVLDIYRQNAIGRQLLVSSRVGADGLFRDGDGHVIGRGLGSSLVVDPGALPATVGRAGAEVGVAAATGQDTPQLCPSPTPEDTRGRSERALAYQAQITGLPPGLEVKLNGSASMAAAKPTARCWKPKDRVLQTRWTRPMSGNIGSLVERR